MFYPTVKVVQVCAMRDMVAVGKPWYELTINGETMVRLETAPVVVAYGSRLTPVAPDRAAARDGDDESSTRAAGEHDG